MKKEDDDGENDSSKVEIVITVGYLLLRYYAMTSHECNIMCLDLCPIPNLLCGNNFELKLE